MRITYCDICEMTLTFENSYSGHIKNIVIELIEFFNKDYHDICMSCASEFHLELKKIIEKWKEQKGVFNE